MPTNVLVLGAGASVQYDFPLAAGIVDRVRDGTDAMESQLAPLGIEHASFTRVVTRLLTSGCTSVDQFAEYLDSAEDIRTAKALIAFHLGIFEVRGVFRSRIGSHWYKLLANQLIGANLKTFPERDVAIVTFNYERSLEQCLLDFLMARFQERHSEEQIRAAFLRLPIIHIYGRMGQLPGFGKSGEPERAYERITNSTQMEAAVASMHILRELRGDPARGEREAVRECLRNATGRVSFLGFAYAQENLEALDLKNTAKGKQVYGTLVGFGESGHDERYDDLKRRLKEFDVELSAEWRFDVYSAMERKALTLLGPPRK